jgi:hypothetical protein
VYFACLTVELYVLEGIRLPSNRDGERSILEYTCWYLEYIKNSPLPSNRSNREGRMIHMNGTREVLPEGAVTR